MRKKGSNFKNKCEVFEKIGKEYKKAIILTSSAFKSYFSNDKVMEESSGYLDIDENKLKYYDNILKLINLTLEIINEEFSFLLRNDFFKQSNCNWWLDYYSRSTYYRIKNKAMDDFLEIFDTKIENTLINNM